MDTILISYRREESAGHAGRIYDRLCEKFGRNRVFIDVSAVEPGLDIAEAVDRTVGSCAVLLVVIDRKWLGCVDAAGKRCLDDPQDIVRLEVGTALRRKIRVVPVLVQNAAMPAESNLPEDLKQLARRNPIEIGESHWEAELTQLTGTLGRILNGATAAAPQPETTEPKPALPKQKFRLNWVISSITAVVVALTGLLSSIESFRDAFVRVFKGPPAQTTTTTSQPTGTTVAPPGEKGTAAETATTPKETGTPADPATGTAPGPARPGVVTVPNLTGQTLDRAVAILKKAGLVAGDVEERESATARPGTVISQSPRSGSTIARGKPVRLVTAVRSPEPALVTVPNVVRQPLERAVQVLVAAGLRPGAEKTRPTDAARPGTVLDQKIRGGSQAQRGTAVDLLVAVAPAPGDATGDSAQPARKVAARGNLDVRQTYQFDLDTGRVTQNDADFWFEAQTATERYLTPQNGAAMAVSTQRVDYQVCAAANFATQRFPVDRLPENRFFCVRTSRGKIAIIKLREQVGPSPGIMKISFVRWE
ncbi:MAG: PASTA domain-containing protein [Geobacter sp.]|nr:PASTA domain-containing protein [Geobacter sp.]